MPEWTTEHFDAILLWLDDADFLAGVGSSMGSYGDLCAAGQQPRTILAQYCIEAVLAHARTLVEAQRALLVVG